MSDTPEVAAISGSQVTTTAGVKLRDRTNCNHASLQSLALSRSQQRVSELTIIIPAYNEEASIADTILSLRQQHTPPGRILVVDDCSTDNTAAIAASLDVQVICPPSNTGSKAGAQTFAMGYVRTPYVMAIDADTALAVDALEKIATAFDDEEVAAACGFVLPRYVHSIWERGRYVEYLYSFTFNKRIHDHYGAPTISSGCFSMYRTEILRSVGAWHTRTLAEDMDLTWTLYEQGWSVRFMPDAICYPIEPHNLNFMSKQLKRWSHGFVQNVRLHIRGIMGLTYLRTVVAIAMIDSVLATLLTLFALPLLAILVSPWFLLAYVLDLPIIAIPVIVGAHRRHETFKGIVSIPAYLFLRIVNCWFMLGALVSEVVFRRQLLIYEKGH